MSTEKEIAVEVHGLVATAHPKEYVEAVVADALMILPAYAHRQDTLVVATARRIAVILDKQAMRGLVIPVDIIEKAISGPMKDRLQAYLSAPSQAFYVMHIAGSWFMPGGGVSDPR